MDYNMNKHLNEPTRFDRIIEKLFTNLYYYQLTAVCHNLYYEKDKGKETDLARQMAKFSSEALYYGMVCATFFDSLISSVPIEELPPKQIERLKNIKQYKSNMSVENIKDKLYTGIGGSSVRYDFTWHVETPWSFVQNYKFNRVFQEELEKNECTNIERIRELYQYTNQKSAKKIVEDIPMNERIAILNKMDSFYDLGQPSSNFVFDKQISKTLLPNESIEHLNDCNDLGKALGYDMSEYPKIDITKIDLNCDEAKYDSNKFRH